MDRVSATKIYYKPTTVDVVQYLDREHWIQTHAVFLLQKNANVKSVLDNMNDKLHSFVFCVPNKFCVILFWGNL